jgi:hypothetical protein
MDPSTLWAHGTDFAETHFVIYERTTARAIVEFVLCHIVIMTLTARFINCDVLLVEPSKYQQSDLEKNAVLRKQKR